MGRLCGRCEVAIELVLSLAFAIMPAVGRTPCGQWRPRGELVGKREGSRGGIDPAKGDQWDLRLGVQWVLALS
jgi:hypothetical protein